MLNLFIFGRWGWVSVAGGERAVAVVRAGVAVGEGAVVVARAGVSVEGRLVAVELASVVTSIKQKPVFITGISINFSFHLYLLVNFFSVQAPYLVVIFLLSYLGLSFFVHLYKTNKLE